jgi:hypothetical protein
LKKTKSRNGKTRSHFERKAKPPRRFGKRIPHKPEKKEEPKKPSACPPRKQSSALSSKRIMAGC